MSEAIIEESQEIAEKTPVEQFQFINSERLERTRDALSPRQRSFLDVLPFLFHVNHENLPGYISKDTPTGIQDFQPDDRTIDAAVKIAKTRQIDRQALHHYDILGLYSIGSPGSIAYNGDSDFDFWLCVNSDIAEDKLQELNEKCWRIEQWAADLNIEAHFFLVDPEKFRAGETLKLSSESSGSAQHWLLLDEFYRSSLLIAGLPPAWWVVPPEKEEFYDDYLQQQFSSNQLSANKFIDLGGLYQIPPEEFFGAAIWQLYKSINSPYKSVLKLLVMEVYAYTYPHSILLSQRLKESIYSGDQTDLSWDPYVQMYSLVEEYLIKDRDRVRLNVLRRSFYLKIGEKLSETDTKEDDNWRKDLLQELTSSWAWDQHQLEILDSQDQWKLETVTTERTDLISALTKSYRMLSDFARKHSEISRITQTDLNILGRKLYSAFERKAGKVEIVNRGISPDLHEGSVSLHQQRSPEAPESWVLYRGIVASQGIGDHSHLKRTHSIMAMLTWCHFNKMLNTQSKVINYLHPDSNLNQQEIRSLLTALKNKFPVNSSMTANGEDLSRSPVLKTAVLFVNTGIHPKNRNAMGDAHLASDRTNALSYGGQHENLALTFDLVFVTSWEEIYVQRYLGAEGLLKCITDYFRWSPPQTRTPPTAMSVHCYSSSYGTFIGKTIKSLFEDLTQQFYGEETAPHGRYIMEVGNHYHVLSVIDDVISTEKFNNYPELIGYLAEPLVQFLPAKFDQNACVEYLLPDIYALNEAYSLQIFFHINGKTANVYILDEKGSLFFQRVPFYDKRSLFGHFKLFADAIVDRRNFMPFEHILPATGYKAEFYEVTENNPHKFQVERISNIVDRPERYLSLQVLCNKDEKNNPRITIYCKDQEFSSLQHGKALFDAVAKKIMTYRQSRQTYPAYITDIDLSLSMLEEKDRDQFQSVQFFKYKKSIESQLTEALQRV